VLRKPEHGFEPIFAAELPLNDDNVVGRVNASVLRFRRHGATIDDRRQAKDENDLFNLANNFGIRHHNDRQKTNCDAGL
jgi:hypothetical protein